MAANIPSSSSSSNSSPSMHQAGPSSYHQSLEDQEESVRIAVRALGDMRSGGGAAAAGNNSAQRRSSSSRYAYDDQDDYDNRSHERGYPSTSRSDYEYDTSSRSPRSSSYATAPTHVSRTTSAATSNEASGGVSVSAAVAAVAPSNTNSGGGLVSRMSHFPLVGSALRVYEQGKASSRVVKVGCYFCLSCSLSPFSLLSRILSPFNKFFLLIYERTLTVFFSFLILIYFCYSNLATSHDYYYYYDDDFFQPPRTCSICPICSAYPACICVCFSTPTAPFHLSVH